MDRSTVSRFLTASAAALLLSACAKSDPRLAKLSAGINADSVLSVMGAPAQRVDRFLVNSQNIEAMYFAQPGAPVDSASATTSGPGDRTMSPAILINGQLVAWGWKQWDSIATANKVAVPPEVK